MAKRLRILGRLLPLYVVIAVVLSVPFWQHRTAAKHVASESAKANQKLSQASPQPLITTAVSGEPSRIIIPNATIDLPIVRGDYDKSTKTWPVNPSAANFATNTSVVNNTSGVTLIYGHATDAIFGKTKSLKPGDKVIVYTDNNHVFEYAYMGDTVVNPTDLSIFDHLDGPPALKLLTCTGTFSQSRRIMTLSLTRAV